MVGIAVPDDFSGHAVHRVFEAVFLQLALPDDDDIPALRLQLAPDFLVSLLVPSHLGRPELSVGLGDSVVIAALVAMPEASVYKDNRPVLWQRDIWFSRQISFIDPVAEPQAPKSTTQLQLRLRRRGVYSCHVAMALVGSKDIRHC